MVDILYFFISNQWEWDDESVKTLQKEMSAQDQKVQDETNQVFIIYSRYYAEACNKCYVHGLARGQHSGEETSQ